MPTIRDKLTGETFYVPDEPASPRGIPIGPQDPTMDLKRPQAGATLDGTQVNTAGQRIDNRVNEATLPAQIRSANAGAVKAEAEAEKAVRESKAEADKRANYQTTAITNLRRVIDKIDDIAFDAADNSGWFETGATGAALRHFPGTAAYDLARDIETVDANSAFSALQNMRDASPTGGALGQITERELDLLKSSIANINPNRSQSDFFKGLAEAKRFYLNALSNIDPTATAEYANRKGIRWDKSGAPILSSVDGEDTREPIDPMGVREAPSSPGSGGNPPGGGFRNSYLGQGISGINEGIASTLGAPVDLLTMAMNVVPRGINAAANTNLPSIENPVLGGQWIRDRMRNSGMTLGDVNDPSKQFVRRMGQSVGAAAVPLAGASTTVPRYLGGLAASAGGGAGAAKAQQVFPGNPLAEMGGELLGSGLTGGALLGGARRAAQRQIEAQIPTVDQLKQQAGDLYRQAESRGVTADPEMTRQLSQNLRDVLVREGNISPSGRISEVYPKAREAIRMTDDYAGLPMNPTQIQTVRKSVADGLMSKDGTERRLSRLMTDELDNWAAPQAPELAQARNIASRYINAQHLEMAREEARKNASGNRGGGYENALRSAYNKIDGDMVKGKRRYNDTLSNAIEVVNRGTPASNTARFMGKFAPQSNLLSLLGAGAGYGAAGGVGALAIPALGLAGRKAATHLTDRYATLAELTARNGGAISQAPLVDPSTQRAIAAILGGQQTQYLADYEKKRRTGY